jgi:ketosteroid isomerase-like protein
MARNLDIVREVFDAFSRRDAQRLIAVSHPDIVFSPPTRNLANEGKPYLGHEGLRRYLADVAEVWQELRSEPTEFIEIGPDRVLCTGRVYAWGVGRVVDSPAGWVWRVQDDLLIEGTVYETRRAAYEAVGRTWPPPDA